MITTKRLVKIEGALSPEQTVLLWLRGARTCPFAEYGRTLCHLPLSDFPRSRINRQVAGAVREAMKARPAELIEQAVRSAAMQADFLILLALTINEEVLRHAECRELRFRLLLEQVEHRGHDWRDAELNEWLFNWLTSAAEVLILSGSVQAIEREHFRGSVVLFSDAVKVLKEDLKLVYKVAKTYDEIVAECSDSSPNLGPLFDLLQPLISFRSKYVADRARSDMLRTFSGSETASSLMRPYWSDKLQQEVVRTCMEQSQLDRATT
jgi:hypothetical protein